MTVSFEAVPHSPSSGVAQPQSSMKESHPAKVHLQEVDQTATASSTSNKSTSLQLLLLFNCSCTRSPALLRCMFRFLRTRTIRTQASLGHFAKNAV